MCLLCHLPLPLQVSRFLAAAWRAPDFVPRYCKLYAHLQRAGTELFGPRVAFTLALRSGFSGALLQQSFLTAAHVSHSPVSPHSLHLLTFALHPTITAYPVPSLPLAPGE